MMLPKLCATPAMTLFACLAASAAAHGAPRSVPKLVVAPVDNVFVPAGFDDNDNVEVVLQGYFANSCY